MKKTTLTLAFIFLSAIVFAQIEKVELTKEEVQYIAESQKSAFGGASDDKILKSVELNKTLFFFEIVNEDEVLYSETIKRSSPAGFGMELDRTYVSFYLNYKNISPDLALNLLENQNWELIKIKGERFIRNIKFKIFKRKRGEDGYNYYPNDEFEGLEIKLYKLIQK